MIGPSPFAAVLASVPVHHDVRGDGTHTWRYGRADAPRRLLFLHGFRGDHHGLEPICAHLVGLRDDVQVLVPDLPGFGVSPPLPTGAHDIDGYAAWAGALLDDDTVLAGHSFGSIVAAATARGRELPGLVLVNPIATAALEGPRAFLSRLAAGYHRLAGTVPERAGTLMLRNPIMSRLAGSTMATTRDAALLRWIHAEHARYFGSFADRRVLLEAFRASVEHHVAEYAADIAAPTLLVAAERDDLAPIPAQRALLGRFPDARLVELPATGHLAHYEAPAVVAVAVAEFLA
ncbi:alpha/beta fold hydrolase [Pseudonocardia sp. GCM10023141]|uniref:alpha/beta fold hydrolase n=1 Tax=Pseudonocardia sp. GCM10023141 TaxID=3252653 RepID=UPI00360C29AF